MHAKEQFHLRLDNITQRFWVIEKKLPVLEKKVITTNLQSIPIKIQKNF